MFIAVLENPGNVVSYLNGGELAKWMMDKQSKIITATDEEPVKEAQKK